MLKLEKKNDKAVLTIYGYVGGYYLSTDNIQDALDEITRAGYNKVDFHIHTYGGYVFDGNLIYNYLAAFKGEVDIYIDGVAASMGSIIIMAGTRIHIAENGFIMIHVPKGCACGNAADLESYAKLLRSMEKNFINKLITRTGKCEDDVKAWFDGTDHWFDADQAIEEGLVDDKFSAKTEEVTSLSTQEAQSIGARAVFDRFTALTKSKIPTKTENEMDKKEIISEFNLTGVTAESSDAEVMAALNKRVSNSERAQQNAEALLGKAIEQAVDQAIAAKKITKEQRDKYIARGEKLGLEDLNAVFADMKAYQPLTGQITGSAGGGTTDEHKDWKWEDYQKNASAELEQMPKKDPEKFKALYKDQFGVEPEL